MHKVYFELIVCYLLIHLSYDQCNLIASYFFYTDLKKKIGIKYFKWKFFYLTNLKAVFFLKELMREKLGTK